MTAEGREARAIRIGTAANSATDLEAFERMAQSLRALRPNLEFARVGPGENDRLKELDLFVYFSRWDEEPNPIARAMEHGLPVVASEIRGNLRLVEHNTTGFTARDEIEVLEYVLRLIDKPALRKKMAEAALNHLALKQLSTHPGSEQTDEFLESILVAIDHGNYSSLEERFLELMRPREKAPGWIRIFFALVGSELYSEAARLGELKMRQKDGVTGMELIELLWPWGAKVGRSLFEKDFCLRQISLIESIQIDPNLFHWKLYFLCVLRIVADSGQREAAFEQLQRLTLTRNRWMRRPFLSGLKEEMAFPRAIAEFRRVLGERPNCWWSRCQLAESYLCDGQTRRALRELEQAEKTDDAFCLREVLTWHGEVLLWLGLYEEALRKLAKAIDLGATFFVFSWRGAAHLKLGDFRNAMADLDRAVDIDKKDMEALVWRGEAHRLQGNHSKALADLDSALERGDYYWAHINRALVRLDLGDIEGFDEDFQKIPLDYRVRFNGGEKALPATMEKRAEILSRILRHAKGLRRSERYLEAFWLR